jgi:hypothetical protein
MARGWGRPALARPRRPGHNDECDSAMASAQGSDIRPPRNPTSTQRPRDGARLERLVETQRLLQTLRRLGYREPLQRPLTCTSDDVGGARRARQIGAAGTFRYLIHVLDRVTTDGRGEPFAETRPATIGPCRPPSGLATFGGALAAGPTL